VVHADADDFRVGRRELRMVVPTGRHFLHSRRGEIEDVELDDDVLLSGKIAQLEFPRPLGARQLEVRRLVAHFQRRCPAGQERQGESEHDCLDETESLHESPFAGKMDRIFKRPFLWPAIPQPRQSCQFLFCLMKNPLLSVFDRYPIRGTFVGCWASATSATLGSTAATRNDVQDVQPAFFMPTSLRRLSRRRLIAKRIIYGRNGTGFVEGKGLLSTQD
jgi:hypothetical protein